MTTQERDEIRLRVATAALQGLIASNFYDRYKQSNDWAKTYPQNRESIPRVAASIAVEYADELIRRIATTTA